MPAGRPPLPTAQQELAGAFKHDPQRRDARANEPQPTGPLGGPPSDFEDAQLKAWNDIVSGACPGVLTNADEIAVELGARTLAKIRTSPEFVTNGERTFLLSLLSRFGMTPADRTRIHIPQKNDAAPNRYAVHATGVRPQ